MNVIELEKNTNRRGLGRGLSALIPDHLVNETESNEAGGILEVALDRITPNPEQPRKHFLAEALAELASSIKEHGILSPLVVHTGKNGDFILIAGERRLRAAGLAGLKQVPVILRENLSGSDQLELALVENLQREDLNAVESALGYARLSEKYNYTQEQVAQKVGKDRATVANTIRLLKLPEPVLELIATGRLSAGHGKALLGLNDKTACKRLVDQILAKNLSVRATERLVKATVAAKKNARATKDTDQSLDYASNVLTRLLSTEVKIQSKVKGGGKITIEYFDNEDLDRLISQLRGH
jgi:ParB family chromosome partitioning protein